MCALNNVHKMRYLYARIYGIKMGSGEHTRLNAKTVSFGVHCLFIHIYRTHTHTHPLAIENVLFHYKQIMACTHIQLDEEDMCALCVVPLILTADINIRRTIAK